MSLPTFALASRWVSLLGALLLCTAFGAGAAQDSFDEASNGAVKSPDGRFVFRQLMEPEDGNDSFGIYDRSAKHFARVDKEDALQPMNDSLTCVWAPDSRHFALNARAGARYDSTQQFEWTGEKFRKMPDAELPLLTRIDADRKAQVKAAKLSSDIHPTRVWDGYTTLRWKDEQTILVSATSIRNYLVSHDEMKSITSTFTFTLKLSDQGRWKVIAQGPPPPKETPADKMTKSE